ncbi:MAG TPA: hypothetical protein PLM56_17480 [Cyclobacteriaceae bacterium]|nr:hypothetical protein [Cyclobacteriaceae bacterium]HRF35301.1 hypothetical protein [Cyclobacteriaceae bacterium]
MKLLLFLLVFLLAGSVQAQQLDSLFNKLNPDSLFRLKPDTLLTTKIKKADSITLAFQSEVDSIQQGYQNEINHLNATRNKLQSKIDSLNNLTVPTEKLTKQIDSVNQLQTQKLNEVNTKVNNLKTKATKSLDEINLPQELQGPVNNLKQSINGFSLPGTNTNNLAINNLDLPNLTNTQLPTLTDQIKLDPNLKNFSSDLSQLNGLGNNLGTYAEDVKEITQGNLNEIKSVDKLIENKVAGIEGMEQLQEGKALMEKAKPDSAALANIAKEVVQEQILNAAQDHFAGKEAVLQQAMDKMSKLKSKYSEVQSLADLPKKLPNPLKGKPFIERLVPGITLQFQKSQYFLLDINPSLQYKIRPRLSAGAGWNERLPFDGWRTTGTHERIYGPRAIVQFKWTKGISFTLQPETMNTTIPPLLASRMGYDPFDRRWITSIFAGIKKEFTVYKKLKGNSELLYNFRDKNGMSPYADKVNVRVGFEWQMKKRPKQKAGVNSDQ